MNIWINKKYVSIDLVTADKQDIADFCIYNITDLINEVIDLDSWDVKADIDIDLYQHGSWQYDVEDTDICYAIYDGSQQILDFIGKTCDEISDMIKAVTPVYYMTEQLVGTPEVQKLKILGEVIDKLYETVDDEITAFAKSDWFEGRGL